ncbi:MAG: glycosyltransferase [Bryobacteraceae bacterium]
MRLLAISDVTLGYGTPQLPLLAASLASHYGAEAHAIEPVQPELPARHNLFPALRIDRIATGHHPHSETGRREYVWRAAGRINELAPDVLVVCCTYCLPVVFRLKRRPRKVIYYSVESIPYYGPFDVEMNQQVGPLVDVIIFPEENRAAAEIGRCGFDGAAKLVLYNATNTRNGREPLPPGSRNGRILYAGTISREHTFADYYAHPDTRSYPMDLYGPLKFSGDAERQEFLASLGGAVRYRGHIDAAALADLRREYVYSMVSWNPINENQRWAAPNKFFDSIADGVPPIAAPHPQCKLIVERYGCGVLMEDWGYAAFQAALRKAWRLYEATGGEAWEEMAAGCRRAVEAELNWENQFARLKPYL